ncbi:hypothetical protein BUALT_Bualt13G0102600 [Buddleja alternifolia]|uniref:DDE Tnp4 domain-containing protein n=1 Tax=Buddleja alternifolia TaxID=168488 RepID=A0AAV6WLK0_9LAMI|nr:hypothetical protein BUALT_Bualt13G0102600 [Buddleja alternifolia]
MDRSALGRLCYLVEHVGGLKDSRYVTVSEKVCIFLSILAHHKKNRIVKFDFWRSGFTISVHFHDVLNAILKLHPVFLVKPKPVDDNCNNPRWKPFKGCLGALDGSYIDVQVLKAHKPRYRTHKGSISVNVLGVVDQDMKFVYALPGWEGSAADSRVLRDAVSRPNGLRVPTGQYYSCDAGYMNCTGFLTPYRSVRYHLDEWGEGNRAPQNEKEYYNMMYSRARNVIERTWGCMKWRWAVLRGPTFYNIKIQNRIILACALLHNYIRLEMAVDPAEAHVPDLRQAPDDDVEYIENVEASEMWTTWRDNLASTMFDEWRGACTTMLPSSSNISKSKGAKAFANRCSWTPREEEVLINSIKGMLASGWKANNGFRVGYLNHLADEMMKMFLGSDEHWDKAIKDRATGAKAEDFTDAANVVKNKEKTVPINVLSLGLDGQNDFTRDLDEDETTSIGQSMCNMPASSSTSKQANKGKRKIMEGLEPIVEALEKFTEKTHAKFSELTNLISHEHKLSSKKEAVYRTVAGIEDLTLQQKLLASNMIVKKHDVLELFFTLPDDARREQVRMMLNGKL